MQEQALFAINATKSKMEVKTRGRKTGNRKLSTIFFGNTFARPRLSNPDVTPFTLDNKGQMGSLYTKLSKHWATDNIAKICNDLPRLISRVVVKGMGENNVLWKPESDGGQYQSAVFALRMVIGLLKALVTKMEEEPVAEAINAQLDEAIDFSKVTDGTDYDNMFNLLQIIGVDSRTYRILKCIHQDYVLIATTDLKMSLTREKLTKDVRGDEGWQIYVTVADFVQIVHRRKEQSMDMPGSENNHFEFTYTISMTFDRNMEEMTAAQLRIKELTCDPNMDQTFRDEVEQLFANGNLIVE